MSHPTDPLRQHRYDIEKSHQQALVDEIVRNVAEMREERVILPDDADRIGAAMTAYIVGMERHLGRVYFD